MSPFVLALFIANTSASKRTKKWITWITSISRILYPFVWLSAALLIPQMGMDRAKIFGEYAFFMPFGGAVILMTWVVFGYIVREALISRKQES